MNNKKDFKVLLDTYLKCLSGLEVKGNPLSSLYAVGINRDTRKIEVNVIGWEAEHLKARLEEFTDCKNTVEIVGWPYDSDGYIVSEQMMTDVITHAKEKLVYLGNLSFSFAIHGDTKQMGVTVTGNKDNDVIALYQTEIKGIALMIDLLRDKVIMSTSSHRCVKTLSIKDFIDVVLGPEGDEE